MNKGITSWTDKENMDNLRKIEGEAKHTALAGIDYMEDCKRDNFYVHSRGENDQLFIACQREDGATDLIASIPVHIGQEKLAYRICQAVNSHDELVKTVEELLAMATELLPLAKEGCGWGTIALDNAREVLEKSKAKGGV